VKAAATLAVVSIMLVVPGCGSSVETPRVTTPKETPAEDLVRVPWSTEERGLPLIEGDEGGVWITSLGGEVSFPADDGTPVSNLFRLDPETLDAQRLPVGRLVERVFSDDGMLWAIGMSLPDRPMEVFSLGFDLSVARKQASACPGGLGGRSVAYGGRLWLDCGHRVLVFEQAQSAPVAEHRVPNLAALLEAGNGLWAASDRDVSCLDGACAGRTIGLPESFLPAGDYASSPGWDVDGEEAWAQGLLGEGAGLARVDLDTGEVGTSALGNAGFYDDIAVVGDEVWVADTAGWSIRRFERALPAHPRGELRLPARPQNERDRVSIQIDKGGGWVWITASGTDVALYRVRIPGS
jgi:hypothetical protein